jgi:DNA polymerase
VQVISQGGSVGINGLMLAREYDYNQGTDCFTITLPSGRKLYYVNPSIGENQWGNPSIAYMGMDQKTKRWKQIETYGGKLVENCVQAIARDALAGAIERLEAAGLPVVFHVHDEVIIDVAPFADDDTMLRTVVDIMREPIPWAPDLPLNADGWVGTFFRKD